MSLEVHQKVQAEGWSECHLQTPLGSDCLGKALIHAAVFPHIP